ncbi:hypothetical protein V8H18_05065 [Lautropia mirabilis]
MSKILNLSDEIALIDSPDFELGKYIYLGRCEPKMAPPPWCRSPTRPTMPHAN